MEFFKEFLDHQNGVPVWDGDSIQSMIVNVESPTVLSFLDQEGWAGKHVIRWLNQAPGD